MPLSCVSMQVSSACIASSKYFYRHFHLTLERSSLVLQAVCHYSRHQLRKLHYPVFSPLPLICPGEAAAGVRHLVQGSLV